MSDPNYLVLVGRLVDNAATKTTANGLFIAYFSIATNRRKKKEDGTWEKTVSFFPVSLLGKRGQSLLPYLVKGQRVLVEGYLEQRRWEQGGKKTSRIEIRINDIQLLSFKIRPDLDSDSDNTEVGSSKEIPSEMERDFDIFAAAHGEIPENSFDYETEIVQDLF